MTQICSHAVADATAWTNESLGGKAGLMRPLTLGQLAAIDELLAKTAHLKPQEVTRAQFEHPVLTPFLAEVRDIIMHGRGAIIVSGLTPANYTPEQLERVYWGFGTHWGHAVTQSSMGDRLGRVTVDTGDNPNNRAYRTTEELYLHTDANEIVGLLCVQKAASGGFSRLASAIAIHNEMLRRRPDLLAPLYEGFYYASRETSKSDQPVTPYKLPIYCYIDDVLSCRYNGEFIQRAGRHLGGLPTDLDEAIKLFHAIAAEIQLEFVLEPGEMMLLNNFIALHARTDFKDEGERKRNLLRLWLDLPDGRKVLPMYRKQALTYDKNDERRLLEKA